MRIETTQIITGAAGMTPRKLTAGGATAAATVMIGPGPTSKVCFVQPFFFLAS
jgi:hypothetical protein